MENIRRTTCPSKPAGAVRKWRRRQRERCAGRIGRTEQQGRAAGRAPAPARLAYTALVFMAPWLPPIVVYCPPAQQCSAVAPPAPPRPPPCRCPPFSPPPPHPPRASPAISLWGRRGGAHGGCALGSLLLGGRGGASVACVMGPPTCAILGRVSRLELARPCAPLARRSWHRAGKTRPARTSGTECHPALCAPNCLSGRSPRTANNTAERPATASRLVRPPLAAGRVRRGRLTRSPLFRSASPCRSCCIVLWSLLGCASVRVCALGARRKRRNR